MVITNVTTYLVRPRWGFVKIETDGGLTGWGEAVIEGKAATVLACVEEMKDYLLGADPMRIEDLWNVLYRAGFYRGGPILMSAMAGIDQALWDIKGKHFNAPVYQLMGGPCRDRMRVYSWIGGDRPSDVAKAAKEKQEAGFTAIKMNGTEELQMVDSYEKIDAVLERVASIREATGKYFGIAVDFHGRVHKPMAKILAKSWRNSIPCSLRSLSSVSRWRISRRSRRPVMCPSPRGSVCFPAMISSACFRPEEWTSSSQTCPMQAASRK